MGEEMNSFGWCGKCVEVCPTVCYEALRNLLIFGLICVVGTGIYCYTKDKINKDKLAEKKKKNGKA